MVRLKQQDVVPSVGGVLNDGVIKVRDALIKIFHQWGNDSMLLVNIRSISVRRKTELEITRNRSVHADGPLWEHFKRTSSARGSSLYVL